MELVIELPLSDEERAQLAKSAASVQSVIELVKRTAG